VYSVHSPYYCKVKMCQSNYNSVYTYKNRSSTTCIFTAANEKINATLKQHKLINCQQSGSFLYTVLLQLQ